MDFETSFAKLIDADHEGGYVNNPADPGGETYCGVSRRAHPDWGGWLIIDAAKKLPGFPTGLCESAELLKLTKDLYQDNYWGPAGCDGIPVGAKFQVFDMAVNSGVPEAVRAVQRAAGVNADGVIGASTLMAVQRLSLPRFVARFNAQRLIYLSTLKDWPTFSRGWVHRIAANLMEA